MAKVAAEVLADFDINLNGWKVRDFKEFMAALSSNDFERVAEKISGVVTSWPFAGDPSNPESLMNLSFAELGQLLRAVNGAMLAAFSQGN